MPIVNSGEKLDLLTQSQLHQNVLDIYVLSSRHDVHNRR